ncbi:MAG: hypothetical protein Q7T21_10250 [Gallionella sp.]|nr:hypothetical protein [Gallionella sp.]
MNISTEWITAFSTAATAIFAALAYQTSQRLWVTSQPSLKSMDSGDRLKDYRHLSVGIDGPDKTKYIITKLVAKAPTDAALAPIESDKAANKPVPGHWAKSLTVEPPCSSVGVFFKASRGSKVSISVHIALSADPSLKSRRIINHNMHD